MDLEQLEPLLRARFAPFTAEHTPPLPAHPADLAAVPAAAPPAGTWPALVERGALSLLTPRRSGGLGLGDAAVTVVAELMGAAGFPAGRYLDTLLGLELLRGCRPSASRDRLLTEVEAGRHSIAVAHRDDEGGRSPDRPAPWASWERRGERVVVSGRRSFVESADEADTLLLVGSDAPGIVLLPADSPALLFEARSTLGSRRLFDLDVYEAALAPSDVLTVGTGAAGELDALWTSVLAGARIRQAAYLTGLAAGALDAATGYAKNRRQFGRPLARFQSIAFRLAASSARVHATRLLVRDTAAHADAGHDVTVAAAEALALAAELGRAVTAESVHVHGAYGMTLQCAAQRYLRDVGMESVWLGVVPELRRAAPAPAPA